MLLYLHWDTQRICSVGYGRLCLFWMLPDVTIFNIFSSEGRVVNLVNLYTGCGLIFARRALDAVHFFALAV